LREISLSLVVSDLLLVPATFSSLTAMKIKCMFSPALFHTYKDKKVQVVFAGHMRFHVPIFWLGRVGVPVGIDSCSEMDGLIGA